MKKELEKDYKSLKEFWNNNFKISEEDKNELLNKTFGKDDFKSLAPSEKQYSSIEKLKDHNSFLDYGCGDGWASIIAKKVGIKNVVGVDVSESAIELAQAYNQAFKCNNTYQKIDENWLKQQKDCSFDAIFSSNVIDVVPLEIAETIIKEIARIATDDADIIFSLNFFMSEDAAIANGFVIKDNCVYVNGILRMLSLSDEEWTKIFEKHFKVISLEHYAWLGETNERRRLFHLKKQ